TSMGGLIGMALAAQPQMALRRLVLNDVGPVIQWEALQRIGSYLGQNPSFDSEQAAVAYLASISTGFGPHTPEQWRDLSLPLLRERDGRWWLHYDPAIATPFKAMTANADAATAQQIVQAGEAALWGLFDAIRVPTLLLRGAQSDLLSAETATLMTQRGPQAQLVTFDGVGHAPTLVAAEQVAAVRGFLWAK
ncbi:alpha/beta hydrolase, partial [Hydrogenophaga sp.]